MILSSILICVVIKWGVLFKGLGAGLIAFCNAELRSGVETILEFAGFEKHLAEADLVITGEGRIDGQSAFGKVPAGVAKVAKKYGIPVIALAGSIGDGADKLYELGIDRVLAITPRSMTTYQAIRDFSALAEKAAERMIKIFLP